MLEYIRVYTEYFSQPEYKNVVPVFGIINEALVATIGKDQILAFYLEANKIIRDITGVGEGNGPYISIHEGFSSLDTWANFFPGIDRFIIDTHPYFSFSGDKALEPIGDDGTGGIWPRKACDAWGPPMNVSRKAFGVTIGGEFSGGYNDCGKYLKGVPAYTPSYGGDCAFWEDASKWNQTTKDGVKAFISAGMDSLGDFFFWTWKIGNSSISNVPPSPLWSYSLGLELGYIPSDPRTVSGYCSAAGAKVDTFDCQFKPWQTGGAGAGSIDPSVSAQYAAWPPATISGASGPYASYAPTGSIVSLADPTAFPSATKTLNGWFNAKDTASAPTPFAGCTYPDMWNAVSSTEAWSCAATGVLRRMPSPTPTSS
jgi:hypothetical protein